MTTAVVSAPAPDTALRPRSIVAILIAGLALRLGLIWTGACDGAVIADDAYYYFTIARNVAAGLGPTFDGLSPTNGYHPLWLVLLTPLAAATARPWWPPWIFVHLALSVCALLDVVAGALMARLLRRAGLAREARWAVALWALGPVAVLTTLRGMESSLAVVLVAGWLLAIQDVVVRERWSWRGALAPGLFLGLAGLARTDNLPFLGFAAVVVAVWAVARRRASVTGAAQVVFGMAAIAVFVMLPWVAWNVVTFGTPFQVSGVVKSLHRGVYGELPTGGVSTIPNLLAWIGVPVTFAAGEEFGTPRLAAAYAWLLLFALVIAFAGWRRSLRGAPDARAVLVVSGIALLAAHAFTYGLVLRSYVVWYAAVPLFLVAALAGGAGVGVVIESSARRSRVVAALVAILLASAGFVRFFSATHIRPGGPERRLRPELTRLVRDHPGVRTVGAFNAGAPGYFAPSYGPLRVVNLDGLVNNALVEAWRRGGSLRWVRRHVDALYVDEDRDLQIWMTPQEIDTLRAAYPWIPGTRIRGPQRRIAGDPPAPKPMRSSGARRSTGGRAR